MLIPNYTPEQLKELYMSKKVSDTIRYSDCPTIWVVLTTNNNETIPIMGLIDTGSTRTILSNKIFSQYFNENDMDSSKPDEMQTAKGFINIFPLKEKKNIRISAHLGNGFNMLLFTGVNIDKKIYYADGKVQFDIGIILGLSFLEQCESFWIDAKNKVFQLDYWS